MEHAEMGCQAPEGPIYCIKKCGFFGSAATMNMCSKCHKNTMLKQEQAKLAASSADNIVNISGDNNAGKGKGVLIIDGASDAAITSVDPPVIALPHQSVAFAEGDVEPKQGPCRCNSCNKRVGLTSFRCKCGELFCAVHRPFENHGCKYDYKAHARDAITKANPVVKAEKLNKI